MKYRVSVLIVTLCGVMTWSVDAASLDVKSFCGIGAQLGAKKTEDASVVIATIIPGGGAERAGLPVGSAIVSVDAKPVKGMTLENVVNLLRGADGTVVSVTVVQDMGLTKTYAITRTQMAAITADTLAGTYSHQDDLSIRITIERVADSQFRIKCPAQHWAGTGLVGNDCFKGVLQMEDHPEVLKDFRGAVSFFRIDFQLGDRLLFRSKFNFFESGDKMIEKALVRKTDGAEPAHAGVSQAEQALRELVQRIDEAWKTPGGSRILAEVISEKAFTFSMPRPGNPAVATVMGREEFLAGFSKIGANGPRKHVHETRSITVVGPLAYEVWTSIDESLDGVIRRNENMNMYAKDESGWKLVFCAPTANLTKALEQR